MGSWYYQFPAPPRMLEAEGAAALLSLAEAAVAPIVEIMVEEVALVLVGEERGLAAEVAPPAGGFTLSPVELRQRGVDALRRGAILIAKLSSEFQLLGFLEIRQSTALRLLERAVTMAALGILVEVIQITPDPEAEMGVAVRLVPFVAGMRIWRGVAAPLGPEHLRRPPQ
jgi:hypothetical protein